MAPGRGLNKKGTLSRVIEVIHVVPRGMNTAKMKVSTVAFIGDFPKGQPPTKRMKSQ